MFPGSPPSDAAAAGPSPDPYPRSNSCILRLGDVAIMQFVDLCRREECLWNSRIPEYKNKERRQQAIVNIARELNINYFESQHVWLKFRNLRNTYCQELKKIAASGGTYTPKVIWFSKIDSFLRPHIQGSIHQPPPQPPDPPKTPVVKQEEDIEDDSVDVPLALSAALKSTESASEDEAPAWWTHVQNTCSNQEQGSTGTEHSDLLQPTTTHNNEDPLNSLAKDQVSERTTTPNKRRKISVGCNTKQIVESPNRITEQMQQSKPQADMFDCFGQYIASLLRSLPRKKGLLLQPQIVNLIAVSAALNLPDRPLP